jgi:tetratricopeptide (TPR) repeat protein
LTKVQKILLKDEYKELKRQIYANLSITHLKLKNYQTSITYSKKVLKIDPKNTKIYHRLIVAYKAVKDYENAYIYMKKINEPEKLDKMKGILTEERKKFLNNCFGSEKEEKPKKQFKKDGNKFQINKETDEIEILYEEPKKTGQMIVVNGQEFWFD